MRINAEQIVTAATRVLQLLFEALFALAIILAYVFLGTLIVEAWWSVIAIASSAYMLLYGDGIFQSFRQLTQFIHTKIKDSRLGSKVAFSVIILFILCVDPDRDGLTTYLEILPIPAQGQVNSATGVDLRLITNPLDFDTNNDFLPDGIGKSKLIFIVNDLAPSGSLRAQSIPIICTLFNTKDTVDCINTLNEIHSYCAYGDHNRGKIVVDLRNEVLICADLVENSSGQAYRMFSRDFEKMIGVLELRL